MIYNHLQRAPRGEEVVDDEDALALGHGGLLLDGEGGAPVLEVEAGLRARAGKLALLANLNTYIQENR